MGLMNQLGCKKGENRATERSKFKFTDVATTKSIRPDKTIPVQPRKHCSRANSHGRSDWHFPFDMQGNMLTHIFFLDGGICRQIHVGSKKKIISNCINSTTGRMSFLKVLDN